MVYMLKPIAERKPQDPALVDEHGETSWMDFNLRVNRLVHCLRDAGLQTGDVFSVLSSNRREYYEAFAAATHGGWMLVPINWHLVAGEVAYILRDSGSKILIADALFAELASASLAHADAPTLNASIMIDGQVPGFISYDEFIASGSKTEPGSQSMGGPMFYTSGTTGHPKGVRGGTGTGDTPIETMELMSAGLTELLELPADGRTLLVGPIYHSAQWAFSFLPLMKGSRVIMRHKFNAGEMLQLIDDYQITNIHLVPTQFVRCLRLDEHLRKQFDGSSLKIIWHGAAACPPEVKRQMIDWWGPIISEYYGSTEGSIVTTVNSEEWLIKPGSLGKPTPLCQVQIIDDNGEPVATGNSGQIYVRNLMGSDFEYHNDREKTINAHLEPGLYTFGDVGYLDEDGCLYMSDRKIDMIISGGVNIYPAEIEAVLINHPSVIDAAVFGIPNEEFGEEVKAILQLVEGAPAVKNLTDEILAYSRQHLAGYKIPKTVDYTEQLPRNASGKLLKRVLREPYWTDREQFGEPPLGSDDDQESQKRA